jgi:hypothetical protein
MWYKFVIQTKFPDKKKEGEKMQKNTLFDERIGMATIPYIEHEKAMYKAYVRQKRTLIALVCSNLVWVVLFILKLGGVL